MKPLAPILTFVVTLTLAWLFTAPSKSESSKATTLSSRPLLPKSTHHRENQNHLAKITRLESREEQVRQVIALASSIPVAEIPTWHRENFISDLDDDLETLFNNITCERWLEANPREFMDWAVLMNNPRTYSYLERWASRDPDAATDFIRSQPRTHQLSYVSNVISSLTKLDPSLALAFFEKNLRTFTSHRDHYLNSSLSVIARADPDAFLAAYQNWPGKVRHTAMPTVVGTLAKQDFPKALALLKEENLSWSTLARSNDPELASTLIANASQLPEGWLSAIISRSARSFLRSQSGMDLLEADPASLGLDADAYKRMVAEAQFLAATPENDSRLMALINGEKLSIANREALLRSKIRKWNSSDPEGLTKWLGQLNDPELHQIADDGLARRQR